MIDQDTELPAHQLSIAVEAEDTGITTAEHRTEPGSLGVTTVYSDPDIEAEYISEKASLQAEIKNQNEYIKELEEEIRCLKEQRLNSQSVNYEIKDLLPIFERLATNTRCSTSTSGTLRARFTNISTLSDEEVHSKTINVAGMDWRVAQARNLPKNRCHRAISIQKQNGEDGTQSYLMAFLEIVSASIPVNWFASVSYTIKLIRYTEKLPHSTHGNGLIFDAENACWGRDCFIDFEDLMNPCNDYVKDDAINMEIDFIVFPSA